MNLYLLKSFNNYFNRRIRRFSSLNGYLGIVTDNYYLNNTNFNPNDGITTSHVIGSQAKPFDKNWTPDYCLVVDDDNTIISRWFVIEFTRQMGNKYLMSLKRDTVSDFYEQVTNSTAYIEKGFLHNWDAGIINNEGIQMNQKKVKELFIKDETKVPWIVAYLHQNDREAATVKATYSSSVIHDIEDAPELIELFPNIEEATERQEVRHNIFVDNITIQCGWHFTEWAIPIMYGRAGRMTYQLQPTGFQFKGITSYDTLMSDSNSTVANAEAVPPVGYTDNGWDNAGAGGHPLHPRWENGLNNLRQHFNQLTEIFLNQGDFHETDYVLPDVRKYNGQTFRLRNGKLFRFAINEHIDPQDDIKWRGVELYEILKQHMSSSLDNWKFDKSGAAAPDNRYIDVTYSKYTNQFVMSPTVSATIEMELCASKPDEGYQTQLQPYDILCFPAFDYKLIDQNGNEVLCDSLASLNMGRALTTDPTIGGSKGVYDVQLLPFCPCRDLIDDQGRIDLRRCGSDDQYAAIKIQGTNTIVGYGIIAHEPFHTFTLDHIDTKKIESSPVLVKDILNLTGSDNDRKIDSNCNLYRIISPNFGAQFDFNLSKCINLGGSQYPALRHFKVDICFRPHNPYIHIAPDFGFLYGRDFEDARGLIFQGDFGLTTLTDAWTEYQVNNKNYQNIFNRQMQNLETNRQIGREKDEWGIISKSVGSISSALIGGVIGGALKGGVAGAIMGGVAGGISGGMGIAGASKQIGWNERSYKEMADYTKDMYEYNLQNIQAIPNTITHSATFTNNYKFFPVVEFYTCTDEEKESFKNKIKYTGMTVGRFGRIGNYLNQDDTEGSYIKAQIIKLELLNEDSHIASDIYEEVNKGLFFEFNVRPNFGRR